MRTIWHSLAWKEWHEHKWNLVSITAILWGVSLLVIVNSDRREILGVVQGILLASVAPLSIFLGMGAAAGERSRGTFEFLQALPVPLWRVALHKFVFGVVTIFVSVALAVMLSYAYFVFIANRGAMSTSSSSLPFNLGTSNYVADSIIVLSYVGLSFFVWAIAIGVNRKDEVSAGALALSVMIGWGILLMLSWVWLTSMVRNPRILDDSPFNWLAISGLSTIPGGLITIAAWEEAEFAYLPLALTVAAALHVGLATRYIRRFGQISDLEVRSPATATIRAGQLDWLGPPRQSPLRAVAWKQFCESGPIAVVGSTGILALSAIIIATNWSEFAQNSGNLASLMGSISASLGLAISMILGLSVFRYDVAPGLNTFWRSRPISPNLWFWIKFLCGLASVLVTIYVPVLLVVGFDAFGHPDLTVIHILHIAVFAAAVAMICLVRHAVYAAILSIAVVYLGVAAMWLTMLGAKLVGLAEWAPSEFFQMTEGQVAAGLLLSFFTSTLIAWLAVRYDWGRKSRY